MVASNTGENRPRPGQFVKGDPRINRKGRPKSFDALRKLAQALANEPATTKDGAPIVIDEHVATQAEMIMRAMMRDNPERFVEIAYGKVPQPVDLKISDGDIDGEIERELARVATRRKAKNAGAVEDASAADEGASPAV